MFFRRNRTTIHAAAVPAAEDRALRRDDWQPTPTSPSDGITVITGAELDRQFEGRPLADWLLEYYDARVAAKHGTQNRIEDVTGWDAPVAALRLMAMHCGSARDMLTGAPIMSRAHFQMLLAALADGSVRYIDNRYDDDAPQIIEATDDQHRWTLQQWGDAR